MTTPAHKGIELYRELDFSKRSSDLPDVYIFRGHHPQRPFQVTEGRTFVVLLDMTEEGKAEDVERGKRLDIPTGREGDMVPLYGT